MLNVIIAKKLRKNYEKNTYEKEKSAVYCAQKT